MTDYDSFKNHLYTLGLASKTIKSYVSDIQSFHKYLNEKGVTEPNELKRFYVVSYKSYLQENHFAIATINKKLNSIQAYSHYLTEQGVLTETLVHPKDKVKVAVGSEGEVDVLTNREVEQILFYLQDGKRVSLRNELIVHLLLYTGVRAGELVQIKLRDLDFLTTTLKVTGKG